MLKKLPLLKDVIILFILIKVYFRIFRHRRNFGSEATKQGISLASFTYRTSHPGFTDVISVEKPVGKIIPDIPEIREKLELLRLHKESYYKRRPHRRSKK